MRVNSLALALAFSLSGIGAANAGVIESFDSGSWGAGWSSTAAGVVNAGAAHDGGFGVTLGGSSWTYNTALAAAPGDVISAWIRPTATAGGRVYLGFGADASGAQSFIGATNTGSIIFQDNSGYNFNDVGSTAQSWVTGKWYRLEIDWLSSTSAIGNLYDSDGTTLLNSISQTTGLSRTNGGVALRGFGGWDLDTLSVNLEAAQIPEPGAVMLTALGLIGLATRRRKQAKAA